VASEKLRDPDVPLASLAGDPTREEVPPAA
jgi:hypothetical protein